MKEQYSVDEILIAIEELQNFKQKKFTTTFVENYQTDRKSIIPSNTLKLIEEAETNIKSKKLSE